MPSKVLLFLKRSLSDIKTAGHCRSFMARLFSSLQIKHLIRQYSSTTSTTVDYACKLNPKSEQYSD